MEQYFTVDAQKEHQDMELLARQLEKANIIDPNTVIVVCSPEYSSIVCQFLSHRLSYLNGNIPLDLDTLEMPYPNDPDLTPEVFEDLVTQLGLSYLGSDRNLLLVDSGCLRGRNYTVVREILTKYIPAEKLIFACLYKQDDSIFEPNYYIDTFNFEQDGGLLFWWENINNPLWPW